MRRVSFALLLFCALPAFADIIHVPGDYPTIQQGINAAVSGDIVMVAAGTYPEEIMLKAGVVVQGAGEGQSIIDGGGDAGDVVSAVGNSITPDTKLSGFTITGARNNGGMPGGAGVFCNSGAKPDIGNCRIEGNDQGVGLWNGSSATVHNCVVIHNIYDGISTGSYATIVNNTIHGQRIGFYDYSGYGPVFMNNIVTGHSTYGIYGPSGGNPPELTYNDVFGNATDYRQAVPGVGCDSADPMYVDSAAGDFHLQPGSPCIDAGNPDPQYNDPDGTRNDMGAYGGPEAVSNLPQITSLVPARNALAVAYPTSALAGFNVAMDPATFTGATFKMHSQLTGWRLGPVSYDTVGKVAELDPDDELWPGELVTVELTNGITAASGDTFPGHAWQFTTEVGGGSGLFTNFAHFPTRSGPNCVVAGDFDADNVLDLAVANSGAGNISVLLGNGDGTFDTAGVYAVGTTCYALRTADFNNDAALDLAVTDNNAGTVAVLLGDGDGTFGAATPYPAGTYPWGLCFADFDADGNMDVAAVCAGDNAVAVLLGNGDGTFGSAAQFQVAALPSDVIAADCNNDGRLDLVVANRDSASISVLVNSGNGSFDPHVSYAAGRQPVSLCGGDFDADGWLDIAVANLVADSVSVLLNDGTGGYGSRTRYLVGSDPACVTPADFDADGDLDLVVANNSSHQVSVLLNTGSGAFGPPANFNAGNEPSSIYCGDFDLDDDLDLAVADYGSDEVTILLNSDALAVGWVAPAQYATAAPETTAVSAIFNLGADARTLDTTSFVVRGARTGFLRGTVSYDSATRTAVFDPTADIVTGEPITALLTRAIRGANGTSLAGFSWLFSAAIRSPSGGAFAAQSTYSTGSEPRGLAVADFDADGDCDIATTSNSPSAMALLRNNGNGTFAAPSYSSVNSDPIALYCADFDNDRDMDVAVFHNEPGTSHLEILKNNGSGTFTTYATYTPAILGQYVSGGDFNSDGYVDLVLTDGWGSQNNIKVLINNGSGGFGAATSYSGGSWTHGIAVLDADNDGDLDIAVANSGNSSLTLLYNDGSGVFSRAADFACGPSPEALYAHDLSGDGRADIAVASTGTDSVYVLLNNGAGAFLPPVAYAAGTACHTIDGGDFDGDGDIDLAMTAVNGTTVVALLNEGDGTFGPAASYAAGTNTWTVGTADFNADGALDLGVTNYSTNNVSVFLATGLGVSERPPLHALRVTLDVSPSPFRSRTSINMQLPAGSEASLKILDVSGRVIRVFAPSSIGQPRSPIVWDGRDANGRLCPPGIYLVKLEAQGQGAVRKAVLTR